MPYKPLTQRVRELTGKEDPKPPQANVPPSAAAPRIDKPAPSRPPRFPSSVLRQLRKLKRHGQ